MTNDGWFDVVAAAEPITQGDIILECPVLRLSANGPSGASSVEELKAVQNACQIDAIIMTQACDLEQNRVKNVIICPCDLLSEFRLDWEEDQRSRNQNPTPKMFGKFCKNVAAGHYWNFTLLNHSGDKNDHRIVDFHEVFTVPKSILQQLVDHRNEDRLRLRSPYREHVSQSFARFFMRVGLPVGISDIPDSG